MTGVGAASSSASNDATVASSSAPRHARVDLGLQLLGVPALASHEDDRDRDGHEQLRRLRGGSPPARIRSA